MSQTITVYRSSTVINTGRMPLNAKSAILCHIHRKWHMKVWNRIPIQDVIFVYINHTLCLYKSHSLTAPRVLFAVLRALCSNIAACMLYMLVNVHANMSNVNHQSFVWLIQSTFKDSNTQPSYHDTVPLSRKVTKCIFQDQLKLPYLTIGLQFFTEGWHHIRKFPQVWHHQDYNYAKPNVEYT